jgi:lysozyme
MPIRGKMTVATGGIVTLALSIAIPQIQKFEGLRHTTYPDIGGVLSICNGHTGPDVRVNTYYTTDQCYQITERDAQKAASAIVKITPGLVDRPYTLASAISFSYNVGVGTYEHSSVAREFNAGNFTQGCQDLLKYTYVKGKYSQGLANRRDAEYKICMTNRGPANVASNNNSSK